MIAEIWATRPLHLTFRFNGLHHLSQFDQPDHGDGHRRVIHTASAFTDLPQRHPTESSARPEHQIPPFIPVLVLELLPGGMFDSDSPSGSTPTTGSRTAPAPLSTVLENAPDPRRNRTTRPDHVPARRRDTSPRSPES